VGASCLLGHIGVIYCPNPLRPASERQVHRLAITSCDTIASLVQRLGLAATPLAATLNGTAVPRRRWRRTRVRAFDVLVLQQVARGASIALWVGESATAAGKSVGWATVLAMAAYVAFNVVVSMALSMLANALAGNKSNRQTDDSSPTAYSIEGGSNSVRPYEPLPLVLGEHRLFPDYASRPFAEFVEDETTTHEVINNTPAFEPRTPPEWSYTPGKDQWSPITPAPPWTLIATSAVGDIGTYEYYGDNAARTYNRPFGFPSGVITQPHTFVVRHSPFSWEDDAITDYESWLTTQQPPDFGGGPVNWRPIDGSDLPVLVRYGRIEIEHTERLTSIFNFGFGDLAIDDLRVGSTPLDSYVGWQLDAARVPPGQGECTVLTGYSSEEWPTDDYPDDCQIVEGGKLEQRDQVLNDGWIERTGKPARYVQIDLAGRLFKQGDGIEELTCTFEFHYRRAGSSAWVPLDVSPATVINTDTTIWRQTFSQAFDFDVDALRVRRLTPEPTDAREVSEMELTRVKFFRWPTALYPAQQRRALMLRASGQINGRIDRLSAMVRAKHWCWSSAAPWSGSYPGDGGAWAWGYTVNPAWLFLFYARGGFLNPKTAPAHLGLAGWLDEPAPGNGERLFGAGLTNDRIDYASIVAWGQFCAAHGLECRKVVTEARSCGDVLDEIAAAGRGSKTWATGKLGVVWEAAGQPDVAAFGMANIIAGSFSVQYLTDDTVDEYALEFTDSGADYEAGTVYAVVPGVTLPVNQQTERAAYSMPKAQAQRLVNLLAAGKHYHRRTITWETGLFGANVQRGDIVRLAHDLTKWAHSGRLTAVELRNAKVTRVHLAAEVGSTDAGARFWLWIGKPDGGYLSVECAPPTERTRELAVIGNWPAADAPGWIDAGAGDASCNQASHWPDSVPEDWAFLAGPEPTPGKRVRIVNTEATSERRLRIVARDEYEAYYPMEWGLNNPGPAPSGERVIARAFNLAALPTDAGGIRLAWELEAANGADVRVAANHGPSQQVPIQGHLTVPGRELLLPAYKPGTHLSISILPVAAGTPTAIEGDSLEITVT
jgi:sulfur carrier protein ThiS